jgi:hypothetical protein
MKLAADPVALSRRCRDREADMKLRTSPLVFSEHCITIAIRWKTPPSLPRFVSLAGGKSVWRPPDVNHDRSYRGDLSMDA